MARIPACSMQCLRVIAALEGDMSNLRIDEREAVEIVAKSMMDDVRSFDFANAPDSDIVEFLGYAYIEICRALRDITDRDCPF